MKQTGRREQGKQERRERILDAAEAMIRRDRDVAFSMRELAKKAGVSFVTPFNLLGSKAGVLVALLHHSMESRFGALTELRDEDPIERIFLLGDGGVRLYADDGDFYRPLIRALAVAPGESGSRARLLEGATALWKRALTDGTAEGLLQSGVNVDLIARQFHVLFRGGLMLWATGETDGNGWLLQLRHGITLALLAAAKPGVRAQLRDRLTQVEGELAEHLEREDRDSQSAA